MAGNDLKKGHDLLQIRVSESSLQEIRQKVMAVDIRYPPKLLSQEAIVEMSTSG